MITTLDEQTKREQRTSRSSSTKKRPHRYDIPQRDEYINKDRPTEYEVKSADENIKSGKAPGADGVCAEMLTAGGQFITQTLTEILK